MTSNLTSERFQSSTLWFGVMAAIVSSFFAYLMWTTGIYGSIGLAILEVPATILASVLCWWLCIVQPQRASILRGSIASLATGIGGHLLFMTWLLTWPIFLVIYHNPLLFLPMIVSILIALAMLIIPVGSLLFLIRCACGLFTGSQRTILSKLRHQHIAVLSLLFAGLLLALTAIITPLGSLFFLIWGSPGGLLGWHLQRTVLAKENTDQQTQEPLQQVSQRWN